MIPIVSTNLGAESDGGGGVIICWEITLFCCDCFFLSWSDKKQVSLCGVIIWLTTLLKFIKDNIQKRNYNFNLIFNWAYQSFYVKFLERKARFRHIFMVFGLICLFYVEVQRNMNSGPLRTVVRLRPFFSPIGLF